MRWGVSLEHESVGPLVSAAELQLRELLYGSGARDDSE